MNANEYINKHWINKSGNVVGNSDTNLTFNQLHYHLEQFLKEQNMACTKECATAIEAANNARRDWENAYIELKKKYDILTTAPLSAEELAPLKLFLEHRAKCPATVVHRHDDKHSAVLRSMNLGTHVWMDGDEQFCNCGLAQALKALPGVAVVRT